MGCHSVFIGGLSAGVSLCLFFNISGLESSWCSRKN